jgi:hypothetical protein
MPAAGEAEIFLELHRNFRACIAVGSSRVLRLEDSQHSLLEQLKT